jgi:murein DD-endopeptidase MepM/ murein hydrolase activator NlpD
MLLMFVTGCATPRPVTIAPTAPPASAMPSAAGSYHRVEAGQTLWRISNMYGVDLDTIVQTNRLPDASKLEAGQLLFIPGAGPSRQVPAARSPDSSEGADFLWPVRGRVATYFGSRQTHVTNKGIDIAVTGDASVVASRAGRVVFADEQLRGCGGTVIIDHGDGFSTIYTRATAVLVRAGQTVRQREPIARIGAAGHRAEPLLHFEVRKGHRPRNPMFYLP